MTTTLISPGEQIRNAAGVILRLAGAAHPSRRPGDETDRAVRALIRMIERESSGELEPIEVDPTERAGTAAEVEGA